MLRSTDNPYAFIHKAYRHLFADVLKLAASLDLDTPEGREALRAPWEELVTCMKDHAHSEEVFMHPLFEQHVPAQVAELHDQHVRMEEDLAVLEAEFERLGTPESTQGGYAWLLGYTRWMADHLQHQYQEEHMVPELMQTCPPEAVQQAVGAIIGSRGPKLGDDLRHIFIALHPGERHHFYQVLQHAMPPPAFSQAQQVIEAAIGSEAFRQLAQA